MKIVFHTGLNKCASTYMQKLLEKNKFKLAQQKICYPSTLTSGIGNGGRLALALRQMDKYQIDFELQRFLSEAQKSSSDIIVVSSEYLHFIVTQHRYMALLVESLEKLSIYEYSFISVIRNVFDHAVSAFKHRCGKIKISSFPKWIEGVSRVEKRASFKEEINRKGIFWHDGYELWDLMKATVDTCQKYPGKFQFVEYSRGLKKSLEKALGCTLNELNETSVNSSISLSEALLYRKMYQSLGVDQTSYIRRQYSTLSVDGSPEDMLLLSACNTLISQQIALNQKTIRDFEEMIGFSISKRPSLNSEISISFANIILEKGIFLDDNKFKVVSSKIEGFRLLIFYITNRFPRLLLVRTKNFIKRAVNLKI